MEKFQLTLKNAKLRTYHLMRWLLIFLNISALYVVSFNKPGTYGDRFGITGTLLLALLFLLGQRKERSSFPPRKGGLLAVNVLICFFWLKWSIYSPVGPKIGLKINWSMCTPVAATIVFELLYWYSVRKFEVFVEKTRITYPSFPKKMINWNELQNIVLKDGILTIDFRNNKVIQQELEEDDSVNEKDFNEFCRQQLIK
jgi:hypothetical protein